MLEVTSVFAANITFNHVKICSSLPAGYLDATTLADYLVKKVNPLPFFMIHFVVQCIAVINYDLANCPHLAYSQVTIYNKKRKNLSFLTTTLAKSTEFVYTDLNLV